MDQNKYSLKQKWRSHAGKYQPAALEESTRNLPTSFLFLSHWKQNSKSENVIHTGDD